ncbi:Kelch motif family protein [Tritrichomonas foetus]|uniref:Kelch motif family protein n=1 Tax=Tritrichomonas foetus TaxID=1144522 RepID=A0A1J4KKC2_9EUKA|nr:Kelch motif family protein [Tritrichomonas foetus]|eukprot:OHT11675.1 Kelch motif family protein [Tritrichomonas foetus]
MGADESVSHPFMSDPYVTLVSPQSGTLYDDANAYRCMPPRVSQVQQILQTGFHAVWSMDLPKSISPSPRMGHFTLFDREKNVAVIGYGLDYHDNPLNDLWRLDLSTSTWSQYKINGLTPRNGSVAVFIQRKLFIFGGYYDNRYIADFHVIDLDSLTVVRPNVIGDSPSPRIGHVMDVYDNKIIVWGGYNGDWLSDLWIYEVDQQRWRSVESEVKGRTAASFTNVGSSLYIFGAAKVDGLIQFNWETEKIEIIHSSGIHPCSEISAAAMTSCGKYLFLIGGKLDQKKYSLLYAFDTEKRSWFIFHIIPDGVTTNVSDGYIDKNGWFMVPRTSQASLVYCEKSRCLKMFLGNPTIDPPMIYTLEMGEALAILNQGNDVLCML